MWVCGCVWLRVVGEMWAMTTMSDLIQNKYSSSVWRNAYKTVHNSICLPVCLYACLSFCLNVCLSVRLRLISGNCNPSFLYFISYALIVCGLPWGFYIHLKICRYQMWWCLFEIPVYWYCVKLNIKFENIDSLTNLPILLHALYSRKA